MPKSVDRYAGCPARPRWRDLERARADAAARFDAEPRCAPQPRCRRDAPLHDPAGHDGRLDHHDDRVRGRHVTVSSTTATTMPPKGG